MKRFLLIFFAFCVHCPAAVIYLRSTDGSDSDNGSTWALAKATLAAAMTAAGAGGTVYVSQSHAETQASSMTLTSPGTAASPTRILCGNDGAEPPTALATTASVTTTSNSTISFAGYGYAYGVIFNCGTGGSQASMNFTSTSAWWWRMEACALKLVNTSSSSRISVGIVSSSNHIAQLLELENSTVSFADAGQGIQNNCRMLWSGTTSAITAASTTLFLPAVTGEGEVLLRGVDVSAYGSGKNLVSIGTSINTLFEFHNCKLGASVGLTTGSSAGQGGTEARFLNCSSDSKNYKYALRNYQGTIDDDIANYRTSPAGATDGTTTISRKMVSSANSRWESPLCSDWVEFWNESTGSVTVTFATITDNVTLTDADAWVEVEALTTSGFPLATTTRDRASNILAAPANQTTDGTSTWTTTVGTPIKQSLSTSVTPAIKGVLRARVCLAKASTTLYFDPLVITGSRQFQSDFSFQNQPAGSSSAEYSFGFAQ